MVFVWAEAGMDGVVPVCAWGGFEGLGGSVGAVDPVVRMSAGGEPVIE